MIFVPHDPTESDLEKLLTKMHWRIEKLEGLVHQLLAESTSTAFPTPTRRRIELLDERISRLEKGIGAR
jgi:hypothetical protein